MENKNNYDNYGHDKTDNSHYDSDKNNPTASKYQDKKCHDGDTAAGRHDVGHDKSKLGEKVHDTAEKIKTEYHKAEDKVRDVLDKH